MPSYLSLLPVSVTIFDKQCQQMLAGLDEGKAEALSLAPAEEFHMISQGDCVAISDEVDDRQVRQVNPVRVGYD